MDNTMMETGLRNIFHFFSLPRELRDVVYSELLTDVAVDLTNGMQLKASNAADSKCLNICRQFKQEYEFEVRKRATIQLSDTLEMVHAYPKLPKPASLASAVEVRLAVSAGPGAASIDSDIAMHRQITEAILAQMPCLRRVSITFNLSDEDQYESVLERLNGGFWAQVPNLASLSVHGADRPCGEVWNWEERGSLCMQWSGETGKVEEVGCEKSKPRAKVL